MAINKIKNEIEKINDGGPAFPTKRMIKFDNDGMTLRDYFAARAMQAMLTGSDNWRESTVAELAYEMADAMMEARES